MFSSFKPNDMLWVEGVKLESRRYFFALGAMSAALVIYGGFLFATGS
jgi:hypothetical protein